MMSDYCPCGKHGDPDTHLLRDGDECCDLSCAECASAYDYEHETACDDPEHKHTRDERGTIGAAQQETGNAR